MPPARGLRRARRPTPCGIGTARARGTWCGRPPRDPGARSSPFASLPEGAHECRELARRPFSLPAGCNLDTRAASGDQDRGLERGGLHQLGECPEGRKYASLNAATVITRSESPCAMSVQVLSRHTKTLPPTRRERSARSPGAAASESATPTAPVTTIASRLSELASLRASRDRWTAPAPACASGAGGCNGIGRARTFGSCTRYDVYSVKMP